MSLPSPWIARRIYNLPAIAICLCSLLTLSATAEDVATAHLDVHEDSIQYALDDSCGDCGLNECYCGPATWPRFAMYLKSGPSFQLGQSLFEEGTSVGYEVAFGGREPLLPNDTKVFFDFGGSYLSAFGEGRGQDVSGTFTLQTITGPQPTFLEDFYEMSLQEISRTSIHTGIGWYHELSDNPDISRIFTFRMGGRLSHIRGHFAEDPSAALQDLIDSATTNFTLAKTKTISQTDIAPGVFLGFELYSARYVSRGATLALVVDSEFATDWVKFENYERGTLVTANILFGLTVTR